MAVAEGWAGNGTASNPYIIEGYDINASGFDAAIGLARTTCYIVIRNNTLHHAYRKIALSLSYVEHVSIMENRIHNNTDYGICVSYSDVVITGNSIEDNNIGIYSFCGSGNITNNTLRGNDKYGVHAVGGELLLGNNSVKATPGGTTGLLLEYMVSCQVVGNNISEYMTGISANYFPGGEPWFSNNIISADDTAIELGWSDNVTLEGNRITAGAKGLELSSSNCTLRNNTFVRTGIDIPPWDSQLAYDSHHIDKSNKLDGKPIFYLSSTNDTAVSGEYGEIILGSCTNVSVSNLNISWAFYGMYIGWCKGINVTANEFDSPIRTLLMVEHSVDCRIANNTVHHRTKIEFQHDPLRSILADNTLNDTQIYMWYADAVSIVNNTMTNSTPRAISVGQSHEIKIVDNNVTVTNPGDSPWDTTDQALFIGNSKRSWVRNNEFHGAGVFVSGNLKTVDTQLWNDSNTLNGKPIIYRQNATGILAQGDYGQVLLVNCSRYTIEKLNFSRTSYPIIVYKSSQVTLKDIGFKNTTRVAVHVQDSSLVKIVDCTFLGMEDIMVYMYNSKDSTVSGNTYTDVDRAMFIESCTNVTIEKNFINVTKGNAVRLYSSTSCTFRTNQVENATSYALWVGGSSNVVHNNSFINNNKNASSGKVENPQCRDDSGTSTKWDLDKKGNYWSEYTTRYPDADNDGTVWNQSYGLAGSPTNYDNYPLVKLVDWIPPDVAAVKDITIKVGETAHLVGSATDNIGIVNWIWSFTYQGNPVTLTGQTASYTFQVAGIYSAELIVYDAAGNRASVKFTITVKEVNLPVFGQDSTPRTGTTGEALTFKIAVTDDSAVSRVSLVMWYGSSTARPRLDMARFSGTPDNGIWSYSITLPQYSIEQLNYAFIAVDRWGNTRTSADRNVTVLDNDLPSLAFIAPTQGGTGNLVQFLANTTDNIGVGGVFLEYWQGVAYPEAANATLVPMDLTGASGNGTYVLNMTLASNSTATFNYHLKVVDLSSNWQISETQSIDVLDDDRTELGPDGSDAVGTTGDDFSFRIGVSDNIGVSDVRVVYWRTGGAPANLTMAREQGQLVGNGTYLLAVSLPSYSIAGLHYYFEANDTWGNWNRTMVMDIDIIDDDGPVIEVHTDAINPTTGDELEFSATVQDVFGVDRVCVIYWFGDDTTIATNATMVPRDVTGIGNGTYILSGIMVGHDLAPLNYRILALDVHGNWNGTDQLWAEVIDNDLPEVLEDLSDNDGTTGDGLRLSISVRDNIGIGQVWVVHSREGTGPTREAMTAMDVTETGNGIYSIVIKVPIDYVGGIRYAFNVSDTSGNHVESVEVVLVIRDNDPPWIEDRTDERPIVGLDLMFVVEVWDNIDLGEVLLEYRYGDQDPQTVAMEGNGVFTFTIGIPRDLPVGDRVMRYRYHAVDGVGNPNTSAYREVISVNPPPVIGAVQIWTVTEETDSQFDLSDYIEDLNDPDSGLVLTCDHEGISVDGLVLQARFEEWRPDMVIGISVSDGELLTMTNITIRVLNVNDPPFSPIILSPMNQTKYVAGEAVNLTAEVWDPDIPAGDILTISWSSDIIGALGSTTHSENETISVDDLPVGVHRITCTVTDDDESRSAWVTIEVVEPQVVPPSKPSPFAIGPIMLIALVLLALCVVIAVVARLRAGRKESG